MSKNSLKTVFVSLTGLLVLPVLAPQASASTTSDLLQCKFNTKQKVVSCCQRILKDRKRPTWMPGGENPCGQVAKCTGGTKKGKGETFTHVVVPKCLIVIPQNKEKSSEPTEKSNNGNTKP